MRAVFACLSLEKVGVALPREGQPRCWLGCTLPSLLSGWSGVFTICRFLRFPAEPPTPLHFYSTSEQKARSKQALHQSPAFTILLTSGMESGVLIMAPLSRHVP